MTQGEERSDMSFIKNNSGMSLITSVAALCLLAFMGVTTVSINAADGQDAANMTSNTQADYLALSGLEWARNKIDNYENPDVNAIAMAGGTFTVTSDPDTGTVTATGNYDIATKTVSMTATWAKDCFQFVNDPTFSFGETSGTMLNVGFQKTCTDPELCETFGNTCPDQLIIDAVTLSWTQAAPEAASTVAITMTDDNAQPQKYYEQRSGYVVTGAPEYGAASEVTIDLEKAGARDGLLDFHLDDEQVHYFQTVAFAYNAGAGFHTAENFLMTVHFSDGSSASRNYVWTEAAAVIISDPTTSTSGGSDTSDPTTDPSIPTDPATPSDPDVPTGTLGGGTDSGPVVSGTPDGITPIDPSGEGTPAFDPATPVLDNDNGDAPAIDYNPEDPCILQMGTTGNPANCGDTNGNGVEDPGDGNNVTP